MKTREDIISAALLKEPHPKYGHYSFGKWTAMSIMDNGMLKGKTLSQKDIGLGWAICTLGADHEYVEKALDGDITELTKTYEECLHPSEIPVFLKWFNASWNDAEAAATVDKKSNKSGKE